jgi:hypothetical protein
VPKYTNKQTYKYTWNKYRICIGTHSLKTKNRALQFLNIQTDEHTNIHRINTEYVGTHSHKIKNRAPQCLNIQTDKHTNIHGITTEYV